VNWISDGHAIEVTFEDQHLGASLTCPYDGRDLSSVAADDIPVCRQLFEEAGTRVVDAPALAYCNVREFVHDSGVEEVLDTDGTQVKPTTLPVPVAYAWDGDWYVLRPAVLLERIRTLTGTEAAS
jgi:hypothetical protein